MKGTDAVILNSSENVAKGESSLATGRKTKATDAYAQANNYMTWAEGQASQASGIQTHAKGVASVAQGLGTVAYQDHQRVSGRYNDDSDVGVKYLEVVGNGANEQARANAYTLDEQGNAWFAGNSITLGSRRNELATREWVLQQAISADGSVNLSDYATVHYVDSLAPKDWNVNNPNHGAYIKNRPFYATDEVQILDITTVLLSKIQQTDKLVSVYFSRLLELDKEYTIAIEVEGVRYEIKSLTHEASIQGFNCIQLGDENLSFNYSATYGITLGMATTDLAALHTVFNIPEEVDLTNANVIVSGEYYTIHTLEARFLPTKYQTGKPIQVLNVLGIIQGSGMDPAVAASLFDFSAYEEGDVVLVVGIQNLLGGGGL